MHQRKEFDLTSGFISCLLLGKYTGGAVHWYENQSCVTDKEDVHKARYNLSEGMFTQSRAFGVNPTKSFTEGLDSPGLHFSYSRH